MKLSELRPFIDQIDNLIQVAKSIPVHCIVNEEQREAYLHGVLDVKNKVLDLVDEPKPEEGTQE